MEDLTLLHCFFVPSVLIALVALWYSLQLNKARYAAMRILQARGKIPGGCGPSPGGPGGDGPARTMEIGIRASLKIWPKFTQPYFMALGFDYHENRLEEAAKLKEIVKAALKG